MPCLYGRHNRLFPNHSRTGVFQKLRKANRKIQADKCEFLQKEVDYHGHIIIKERIKLNPFKVGGILNFP